MVDRNHCTAESFATNSLENVKKYTNCYEKKRQMAQEKGIFYIIRISDAGAPPKA